MEDAFSLFDENTLLDYFLFDVFLSLELSISEKCNELGYLLKPVPFFSYWRPSSAGSVISAISRSYS